MVSGTFTCSMNAPESETDAIRDRFITQQFSELDAKKEERKKEFANHE